MFEDVKGQICDLLAIKVTADNSVIERRLTNTPGSCLFHIGLGLSDWNESLRELVQLWLRWIAGFDLARARYPIVTLVTIEYPSGFLRRIWSLPALNRLRRVVRAIASEAAFDITVQSLPELHSVRFDDIEQWIREYVEDVDREVLRRRLRQHFSRAFGWGERRLSMYDAAEVVKRALSDPSIRISLS